MMFNLKKRACFINSPESKRVERIRQLIADKKKIRLNKILNEYSHEMVIIVDSDLSRA